MIPAVKPFEQLCFENVIAGSFILISQGMNDKKVEWVVWKNKSVQ